MDARQLEYFVAVAEELSFTRAAQRFRVVQSALSSQIARLEREHGVVLFDRTSRTVRLAPAGEILLPRARAVLDDLRAAGSELAAFSGLVVGHLRLGVVEAVATAAPAVESAIATLRRRHPGVAISVVQDIGSRLAHQVRAGELDLAATDLPTAAVPNDLQEEVLVDEPLVVVTHRSHAPEQGSGNLEVLFTGCGFVDLAAGSGLRLQVDAALDRAAISRRTVMELPNLGMVMRFVALGIGTAIVPRSSARESSDEVAVLDLADPRGRFQIGLITAPGTPPPAVRAFVGLLRSSPDAPAGTRISM